MKCDLHCIACKLQNKVDRHSSLLSILLFSSHCITQNFCSCGEAIRHDLNRIDEEKKYSFAVLPFG